jgi:hypothetical protein
LSKILFPFIADQLFLLPLSSYRFAAFFAGPYPHASFKIRDEYLAVADISAPGAFNYGIDRNASCI